MKQRYNIEIDVDDELGDLTEDLRAEIYNLLFNFHRDFQIIFRG